MGNSPAARPRSRVDVGGGRADVVFDVLAHPYRRFVLWYLAEADGQSSVEQLSRELEAWQSRPDGPGRGVAGVATIALALRHTHLPKLEDADMVEHGNQTVALDSDASDALEHIDVAAPA